MKQLNTLLFLFTAFITYAQEYVPMAVDSATWVMASTDENPEYNIIVVLRIEGDTLVNSLTYSKIYKYDYHSYELILSSRSLVGLIRDDVDERKVYGGVFSDSEVEIQTFMNDEGRCAWGNFDDFNEYLLYDFSLVEGDSIDVCMISRSNTISMVDTMNRFGYHRRTLYVDEDLLMMSEGVGTCMGIFKGNTCYYTGGGYNYGLYDYCIGSFDQCGILTSIHEEDSLSPYVSIYPNPVSDELRVDSDINIRKMGLYNLSGKLIMETANTEVINMQAQNAGIYYLKVYSDIGGHQTFKVVKQ